MSMRLTMILGTSVLIAGCLISQGCSTRKGAPPVGGEGGGTGMGASSPAAPDCYKTAGAKACPPDPSDPSGKQLPAPGSLCTLPVCTPCGSANAPTFRDFKGVPQAGWCLCVPKSDDSGLATYSCFTVADWRP